MSNDSEIMRSLLGGDYAGDDDIYGQLLKGSYVPSRTSYQPTQTYGTESPPWQQQATWQRQYGGPTYAPQQTPSRCDATRQTPYQPSDANTLLPWSRQTQRQSQPVAYGQGQSQIGFASVMGLASGNDAARGTPQTLQPLRHTRRGDVQDIDADYVIPGKPQVVPRGKAAARTFAADVTPQHVSGAYDMFDGRKNTFMEGLFVYVGGILPWILLVVIAQDSLGAWTTSPRCLALPVFAIACTILSARLSKCRPFHCNVWDKLTTPWPADARN
jgi:hypothetical protein